MSEAEKTVVGGREIVQSNRLFIRLAEIGHCDANGKTVMGMKFSGKGIADPDKPLSSLATSMVREVVRFARYTTDEAMEADIAQFYKTINLIVPIKPEAQPCQPTGGPSTPTSG